MIDSTWRPFDRPVPPNPDCEPCPVGVLEMAARLDVKDRSIHMMRRRGVLPRPDYGDVNGSAAWEWRSVLWWAGETGRLRTTRLVNEFKRTFGEAPPDPKAVRSPNGVTRLVDAKAGTPAVPSMPARNARKRASGAAKAKR